jgi:hypothetical protein
MLTGTRRTVLMLAGCQALSMTGGSIVGLTGAIVGRDRAVGRHSRPGRRTAGIDRGRVKTRTRRQITKYQSWRWVVWQIIVPEPAV